MQSIQADFLVVMDLATNFIFVEKIPTKSCKNIINGLNSIFEHFGCPTIFSSDNMTGFTGRELREYLETKGIQRNPGAPYYSNHQKYAEGAINIVKRLYQKETASRASFRRMLFLHNAFPSKG